MDTRLPPCKGRASKPLLTGSGQWADRPLFWEHEGNAAIRVGDRKLVRKGTAGAWELFDLSRDRTEQHDLATQHPDVANALQRQWLEWAMNSNVLPKPPAKSNRAANKKKGKLAGD